MAMLSKLAIATVAALLMSCATTRERKVTSTAEAIDSSAAWASLDPDSDGVMTIDELEQQRAMGLLQDFPNADTDHDQRISKAEWDAWWPTMTDHHVREGNPPQPTF